MVISKSIFMIELSKCPQCAPDDRVVIAGKEFCMRCGTPAEDNAMMASATAATAANAQTSSPQSPSVAKFNTAPPTIVPIQQPATPIVVDNSAVPPAPTTPPLTTIPPVPPVTTPTAIADTPLQVNDAAAQLDSQIPGLNTLPPSPSESTAPITAAAVPDTTSPTQVEALALPQQLPQPMPQAQSQASTAPEFSAMAPPSNQQLNAADIYQSTSPAAVEPLSATLQPALDQSASSNLPPSTLTQDPIQLSNQGGVLSDAQFDELQNSLAPAPLPVDSLAAASSPVPVVSPAPVEATIPQPVAAPQQSRDIYSSPIAPSNLAINASAVEQVSANPAEQSNKTSSIKKVLKPAGVAVSIVTLFMVGAYIWKVNYPNLAFKIASAKSGIVATVPGYMPSGFDLNGEIQTNPGSISYSLLSTQSNKSILITQSKTDWDSQTLAENYVAPKAENYLSLQAQGLTIYILGKNQATWVNRGTWYKIESSDQSLDQDQIIRMATSL